MLKTARVAIINEIHSFAADDRGWHLLAVLERVCVLAGCELQRIGLSATVGESRGDPDWLAGHCDGKRTVAKPATTPNAATDVMVNFVASAPTPPLSFRACTGEKSGWCATAVIRSRN